jgi:hypothetical protein
MKNTMNEKGVTLEVLGKCMTNTTPDSQHDAKVEYRHLWSYAQQAALIVVSDKNATTGCYELITDPERRAKRIACLAAPALAGNCQCWRSCGLRLSANYRQVIFRLTANRSEAPYTPYPVSTSVHADDEYPDSAHAYA